MDVVSGRGSWADVAMNAAFLLAPGIGGAAIAKLAKKFANAADGAGDVGRAINKADDLADGAKAVGKADDVGDLKRASNIADAGPDSATSARQQITKPYKRPTGATTPEQRAAVQGGPCVTCGQTAPKMYADHKTPLVKEYYTRGGIDEVRMRSVDAVQPQCPTCSNRQGAALSQYSGEMKELLGFGP